MSAPESYSRAVGALFEAADAAPVVSLAPLTEAIGGSYGLLFRTGRDRLVAEGTCHGVDLGYVTRLKEASRLRLLPPWLDRLQAGSVVDRAAFGSDQQFDRTDFYNHVIRPEGRFHCVIATPFAAGDDRFHLVVGRPHNKREFDGESRRLLGWMLPHVAEILRLRVDLATTRRSLDHAEQALDGLQQPVFVVTADAVVLSANASARRLVALRDSVWCDPQGRLTTALPTDLPALRKAIRQAVEEGAKTFLQMTRGPSGCEPLRLTLSLLAGHEGGLPGSAKVLVVAEPRDTGDAEERLVGTARTYGLTKRECEVVMLLARGLTLKLAARDLGMSYNTARSYVRQIFEKTDVNRQSDLLRLFATGQHPAVRPPG